MEELRDLYIAVDEAFAGVRDEFRDEVRCGLGCDDCCHAVFDVSLVEALGVLAMFKGLAEETRSGILEKATGAKENWDQLLDGPGNDPALARIRCPMLRRV